MKYEVSIKETSKELSARERIMLKDTGNAVKLDEVASGETPFVITPVMYAVLSVHNEKAENEDYEQYIIVGDDGYKYVTGSSSFWSAFMFIKEEMGEEPFSIEVYKKDSKNYKGKKFLTCSIV